MSAGQPDPRDDCPLPVAVQRRNIYCFAAFWSIYYLAAPVSYIGITHANLLKGLGNNDTVSNLPSAMYLWLTVIPVVAAWLFPQPRYIKPLGLIAVALMASISALVALCLGFVSSPRFNTGVVIAHGAVFGAANGVLLTAMWDALKRGASTSRRGAALALTFGVGPLLACVGALFQDAAFDGKLLGFSFGLTFPHNYLVMFAAVTPLFVLAGVVFVLFRLPMTAEPVANASSPLSEIGAGMRQFVANRAVLFAVAIYVVVYSGGNTIFQNVSLHAKDVLGGTENTLGIQSFLRFGCKAVAGALLGWFLATASPRATLLATTCLLLLGMGWALNNTGWWFMATFSILGAGELFGVYFPNYVTTASQKKYVRVNMAYLSVLSALTGFSSLAFGLISDEWGRLASFRVAAGMLVFALILICLLLPADPTQRENDHVD